MTVTNERLNEQSSGHYYENSAVDSRYGIAWHAFRYFGAHNICLQTLIFME